MLVQIDLPSTTHEHVWARMPYSRKLSFALFGPVLIFLSGCGPKLECDSFETRNAVLKIVSDDHRNALATFAAKNSNIADDSERERSAKSESAKPLYSLGERMVTTSASEDKRTLTCSGAISVVVGDTKASKEVNFTVQRPSDGQISVSVVPFQF